MNIDQELTKLQSDHKKEIEALQIKQSIYNAMPEGLPEYKIFLYNLYGRIASIKFEGIEHLAVIRELLPPLPLVTTAKGSTFGTFLPDICTQFYNSHVTRWDGAGLYLFKLSYSFHRSRMSDCVLTWFTEINEMILEINVETSGDRMIHYRCENPNQREDLQRWNWKLLSGFDSGVRKRSFYAGSVRGRSSVTVYCPDKSDIFDMFDFSLL